MAEGVFPSDGTRLTLPYTDVKGRFANPKKELVYQ